MKSPHNFAAASLLAACVLISATTTTEAHCDRLDGPVAADAREALESGTAAPALIWVGEGQEDAVQAAFEHARSARAEGPNAATLAERYFIETVVRLHREAEGMPYTGVKPAGLPEPPDITAADRAIETGDLQPVIQILEEELEKHVRHLFEEATHKKNSADRSVQAGREWADAYVRFIVYVHGLYATMQAGPEHGVGEQ